MKTVAVTAIIAMLLISSCASINSVKKDESIGPYSQFSGRLIVIEPARRWQVVIAWNGTPEKGLARLTHAASNRIIQLAWQKNRMRLLDNQHPAGTWQTITPEKIAAYGIILPPQQLAMILQGKMPETMMRKSSNEWAGRINDHFLRIKWSSARERLEMIDTVHGRRAILIINP